MQRLESLTSTVSRVLLRLAASRVRRDTTSRPRWCTKRASNRCGSSRSLFWRLTKRWSCHLFSKARVGHPNHFGDHSKEASWCCGKVSMRERRMHVWKSYKKKQTGLCGTGPIRVRVSVLFIGSRFSNLYTAVVTPSFSSKPRDEKDKVEQAFQEWWSLKAIAPQSGQWCTNWWWWCLLIVLAETKIR